MLMGNKSADDYEIDPSQLKLGAEIGKGAFGRVHLATAENLPGLPGPTLVAVKQMKSKFVQSYTIVLLLVSRGQTIS